MSILVTLLAFRVGYVKAASQAPGRRGAPSQTVAIGGIAAAVAFAIAKAVA